MEEPISGGLLIYPAYFKATIVKGIDYSFTINIKNEGLSDILVSPSYGKFSQQKETNQNLFELTDSFENWFQIDETTIFKGTTGSIDVILNVPETDDLKGSSYFPAIVLTQSSEETTDTAIIATEQVIPIYLDFPEDRDVSSSIDEFNVSRLVLGTKVTFEIKVTNNGNTYFAPTSYIEFIEVGIINPDERTRIETIPVSKGEPILLPESYISESIDWNREKFGKYEATLHVMNAETELETLSTTFWVVPQVTLIYALGIIVGISLAVVAIKAFLKRRTKKSS